MRALLLAFMIAALCLPVVAADLRPEVLQQLRKVGSDVSRAHVFQFYLYVPNEGDALAAKVLLVKRGLSVTVRPAAQGPNWLCLSTLTLVPESVELSGVGELLNSLAQRFHGEFDGWEAEVLR